MPYRNVAIVILTFWFILQPLAITFAAAGFSSISSHHESSSTTAQEEAKSDKTAAIPPNNTEELGATKTSVLNDKTNASTLPKADSSTSKPTSDPNDTDTKKIFNGPEALSSNSFNPETSDLANPKNISKPQVQNDQTTGALAFVYPFDLPKGRNGLTPSLGLRYNSQNLKNSIAGFAWNLSIPYIERLNKNGMDTLYTANTFTSSEQGELGLISGTIYKARDTGTDFTNYELRSNAWVAITKDGTKYFYGTAAISRMDDPSDASKVYRWMLDEVRDTNGNSIFYTYSKLNGQIYPSSINYTKNDAEIAPYQVSFAYVTAIKSTSYQSGFLVETAQKLSEVIISFNGSWVKKYTLTYTQDTLNQRSRLTSIALQGRNDAGIITSYPATTFEYQQNLPSGQPALISDPVTDRFSVPSYGAVFVDINSDGLIDMVKSSCTNCAYPSIISDQKVYLNNGTQLVYDDSWQLPTGIYFYAEGIDQGYRMVDVNGDFKPDIVWKVDSYPSVVYLNNGTNGWTLSSPSRTVPHTILQSGSSIPTGQHFIDYTGDGYTDSIRFYVRSGSINPEGSNAKNNGNGSWNDIFYPFGNGNNFTSLDLVLGLYISDLNYDGLPDLIKSYNDAIAIKKIALNNGTGSGFADTTTIDISSIGFFFPGFNHPAFDAWYSGDVNNDGLDDVFLPDAGYGFNTQILGLNTFMNTTSNTWRMIFHPFAPGYPGGRQFVDINGDGSIDSILAYSSCGGCLTNATFINQAKNPELLTKINYPKGGNTTVTYDRTNKPVGGVLKNPKLPIMINVVSSISTNDGNGNTQISGYTYEGGEFWNQTNPHDRKFAGFSTVTETTANAVTKTYHHQGNTSNNLLGEYHDARSKIGKVYRKEVYDTSSNLYLTQITKWDSSTLSANVDFVFPTRTLTLTYDGNAMHRDTAEEYTYDSYGNLATKTTWGEVTGSDEGTFVDTGSDKFTTTFSYASNLELNILSLPSQESLIDQSASKVREEKSYYDGLSLGAVSRGNLTKLEQWKAGTAYINTQRAYNNYGLITQELDPRGKPTNYIYDSYNLYPAIVINALNQSIQYLYDYSFGKVKQITAPNNSEFQNIYDGLGRLIEEKQPDTDSPSTLVTKTTYTYTELPIGTRIKKTLFLDNLNATDTYTYTDGLDRVTQVRKEAEASDTFTVTDFVYNNIGQLQKISLPYFSSGSSRTPAAADPLLYTSYTYDSLLRITSTSNAIGVVTNAYGNWKVTVTDARGNIKNLYKDAYGNLIKVEEFNMGSTYTTTYEYDGLRSLTKITDANSNIRNFTYDALGRRLSAQDLHAPSDTTFGTWVFSYDDSGNLISRTDPKNQTVNYSYDNLNRILTEDFTGQTGVEVTYTYDTCPNGIGRLCAVANSSATENRQYDSLGQVMRETKVINSVGYQTDYTYDRVGNILTLTNPDNAQVKYNYNSAGLLEKVRYKEASMFDFINLILNFDYSPLEKVTYQEYANGTSTINTYDASQLYRLKRRVTTGLSWISKTGFTKLGLREGHDVVDSPFVGSTSQFNELIIRASEYSGASFDPILEVSYTLPPSPAVIQDLTYTYDPNGNITQISDNSATNSKKTVTYTYDDLNRLTSATCTNAANGQNYIQTYAYDAIGRFTSKSDQGLHSYNGHQGISYANPHAVTSIGATSYTYDDNGNLLSVTGGPAHTWDYNNRLTQTIIGTVTTSYAYDYSGQRVKYSSGMTATFYPSKHYNIDGTTATKHIFVGEQLIAAVLGAGSATQIYSIHTDHLSGSSVISNETATVEEVIDYYPYGDIRLDEKAGFFSEQRRFTGHEYDQETGLSYMNARYYNGKTGRFISQDPAFLSIGDNEQTEQIIQQRLEQYLSDPQNLNSYSYALNNPLINIDPNGQFSIKQAWNAYGQAWRYGINDSIEGIQQGWNNVVTFSRAFTDARNQWIDSHTRETEAIIILICNWM